MSKIADRIIPIPEKVKINLGEGVISAEGPLGKSEELSIPATLKVIIEENKLSIKAADSSSIPLAGTFNALISNNIKGVVKPYEVVLEIKGVGYKVLLNGNELELFLGKSHTDRIKIREELEVKVESSKIIIKGKDKQKVSSFAANIRCLRLPSIYKRNKGIYYLGEAETIKVKAAKSASK